PTAIRHARAEGRGIGHSPAGAADRAGRRDEHAAGGGALLTRATIGNAGRQLGAGIRTYGEKHNAVFGGSPDPAAGVLGRFESREDSARNPLFRTAKLAPERVGRFARYGFVARTLTERTAENAWRSAPPSARFGSPTSYEPSAAISTPVKPASLIMRR